MGSKVSASPARVSATSAYAVSPATHADDSKSDADDGEETQQVQTLADINSPAGYILKPKKSRPPASAIDAELVKRLEEDANHEVLKKAVTHAAEDIFLYAPVRLAIKMHPYGSPVAGRHYIWITIDDTALGPAAGTVPDKFVYPDGVAVDLIGNIYVPAIGTAPERVVMAKDMIHAGKPPPVPTPPTLDCRSETTLRVSWPAPSTIIDKYELQCFPVEEGKVGSRIWRTICNPCYDTHFTLSDLPCDCGFQFRVRSHSPCGWSEFSAPSPPYFTHADVPSRPEPPTVVAVPGTFCRASWVAPSDNGAIISMYTLRGKLVNAPPIWDIMFEGNALACDLPDLQPDALYQFQVMATNIMGSSPYSTATSFKAPTERRPGVTVPGSTLRYLGDWVEQWDDAHETVCYIHTRSGLRSATPPPAALQQARSPSLGAGALVMNGGVVPRGGTLRRAASTGGTSPLPSRTPPPAAFGFPTVPGVVGPASWTPGTPGVPGVPDTPEVAFRKKRFRLLSGLRRAVNTSPVRPGSPAAAPNPLLSAKGLVFLELDRKDVFRQSFEKLRSLGPDDMCRKLRIYYVGEEGIDSGGLTKDWFLQVSREMFNPQYCLFRKLDVDETSYIIDPNSNIQEGAHLAYFRFVGRFLAKALFDVQLVDVPLCGAMLKHLLGQPVGFEDLKELDEVFANSLQWMLDNDITGAIDESFAVEEERFGEEVVIPLKPGGADIPVTQDNKAEYVKLLVTWRLSTSIRPQLDALQQGFYELIPLEAIMSFDVSELRLLLNGKPSIDIDEIKARCAYQGGFSEHSETVILFWRAMSNFDAQDAAEVIRFATGTSKMPLDGFDPPLTLVPACDLPDTALPKAHTCFNQLVLPAYPNLATMAEKLLFAAYNTEGFELG